jgi:alpha-beta hydrolase superfamily lysophospholipase
MSAKSFELLLETAFAPETPQVFEGPATAVYQQLEQALKASRLKQSKPSEEVGFRFERVRLGVAIALIKAYARLADNEGAKDVLALLLDAVKAKNTREIDKIIQKKIALFDNLYHEIFVNEQREHLLAMFEQTLDATSKEEIDELILEGLETLQNIDFEAAQHDEDDDEPLDEDFLKSIK